MAERWREDGRGVQGGWRDNEGNPEGNRQRGWREDGGGRKTMDGGWKEVARKLGRGWDQSRFSAHPTDGSPIPADCGIWCGSGILMMMVMMLKKIGGDGIAHVYGYFSRISIWQIKVPADPDIQIPLEQCVCRPATAYIYIYFNFPNRFQTILSTTTTLMRSGDCYGSNLRHRRLRQSGQPILIRSLLRPSLAI